MPPGCWKRRGRPLNKLLAAVVTLLLAGAAAPALPAQGFSRPGGGDEDQPPPRDIPFETTKWTAEGDDRLTETGKTALSINAGEWKHSETEHFIVHFRRQTEARRVVRQIEFDLWYIAKELGFTKKDYAWKSHVFVFEGTGEWQSFLKRVEAPPWAAAFAEGDNLFLNVRGGSGKDTGESQIAHETTHAVVARLYPRQAWPLWLNEGMAEYMSTASVAARRGKYLGRLQEELGGQLLPLDDLVTMTEYPEDSVKVAGLYRTGEALVRYLHDEHGVEKFREFIRLMTEGGNLEETILKVYPSYKTGDDFKAAYRAKIK